MTKHKHRSKKAKTTAFLDDLMDTTAPSAGDSWPAWANPNYAPGTAGWMARMAIIHAQILRVFGRDLSVLD